jgi:hypothetical protein
VFTSERGSHHHVRPRRMVERAGVAAALGFKASAALTRGQAL